MVYNLLYNKFFLKKYRECQKKLGKKQNLCIIKIKRM